MPISATGMLSSNSVCLGVFSINQAGLGHLKSRQPYAFGKEKGFTLIELLVVLVIIGVLTSLIGLSIAPNKPSPQKESRRFYQVLEAARQQAVLFNQDLGVELTTNSYQVLHWRAQQWWSSDNPMFSEYRLPENLNQTLWLDGLENENESGDSGNPQPQILLFATGEVTPFGWTLNDPAENNLWRLSANPLGVFDLEMESLR